MANAKQRKQDLCRHPGESRNPASTVMPAKAGIQPAVIYGQDVLYAARGHACMDAGGRAASGTKAEESSGLNYTFPRSGNDNSIRQAQTGKRWNSSNIPPAPFLDSGLRLPAAGRPE